MKYTTVYKLTTNKSTTRPGSSNETQWGPNITHTAPGGGGMCTANWIHAYSHPFLAVLLNAAHANYHPFQLWKCRAIVGIRRADKLGCTELTTLHQISIPNFTVKQKIAFAIYVSLRVYKDEKFGIWAKNWISGKDRTPAAVNSAYAAAYAAVNAAKPLTDKQLLYDAKKALKVV